MLKKNTKGFLSMLSISGLILLLLLSPCSVRNSIQSVFGVPQTTVSNISKTIVSNVDCSAYESTQIQSKLSNHAQKLNNISAFFTSVYTIAEVESKIQLFQDKNWIHTISIVPSYILYQNFRVFL